MTKQLKKQYIILIAVVFALLVIDQAVKIWIKTSFEYNDGPVPIFGNWFRLLYIENPGMAFGATFGGGIWGKLILSIFRFVFIIGIVYFLIKKIKEGVRTEFVVAIGLILAGAAGNLIDSMFYDFIFPYDPCISFNHMEGSGIVTNCGWLGKIETRHTGFLLGNVVDMFQFNLTWPKWVPGLGGTEVFPAIWNVADSAISAGVILILIRQKAYFPKTQTSIVEPVEEPQQEKTSDNEAES